MSRTIMQREVGYGDLQFLHLIVSIASDLIQAQPDREAELKAELRTAVRALHDAYVREVGLSRQLVKVAEQDAAVWQARYWQYRDQVKAQKRRVAADWVSERLTDRFDPSGYFVYLLWGESDDVPIYVGQSNNICGRIGTHMSNWYGWRIRSVSLIRCTTEIKMTRTERQLIRRYQPELNRAGKSGGSGPVAA
jgi:excinuclease UvrABC nuclease subunit